MISSGQNSYGPRVTDTALGTIHLLEANVQCFEERASKLEYDITDANRRAKELEPKSRRGLWSAEERYQELTRRQGEIEEKPDLTTIRRPVKRKPDGGNEEKMLELKILNYRTPQTPCVRHHMNPPVHNLGQRSQMFAGALFNQISLRNSLP